MDREDGEMSDDNSMLVDEDTTEIIGETKETITLYSTEKYGVVIKKLEKVDASKLEERSKRFGLTLTGNKIITQKQIDELYENCGIESKNERHFRFDTIHLSGIGGLTTKEIFQYLEDYKPVSLEWIDSISCNVVCQDHISAALALLAHSKEVENIELKLMLAEKSNYHWREGIPLKENLILMRFATKGDKKISRKKSEMNNDDCKHSEENVDVATKNPWGDLCKSWGVYDHQEVFHGKVTNDFDQDTEEPQKYIPVKSSRLAMRLGKRNAKDDSEKSEDSGSDSEWKTRSKIPRMRMHADDEESKQKKKLISTVPKEEYRDKYAPLSIEFVNSSSNYKQRESTKLSDKFKYHNMKTQKLGIQSRLGQKIDTTTDNCSSDESESSRHSDSNIMSQVQKVSHNSNASSSIWSRLEVTQGNTSVQSDLRSIIKSKKQYKPDRLRDRLGTDDLRDRLGTDDLRDKLGTDDLRDRLGKMKQSNIRIEIDNSR